MNTLTRVPELLEQRTSTVERCQRLLENALDLGIALDDIDVEIAPLLARRAELEALLRDAETEMAELFERMPARMAA